MNISPFAFPLFGCFIIFILWFNYERRKHEKIEEKRDEDFWKREHDANFTRRKNLDAIEYIKIPYDSFPMEKYADSETISQSEIILLELKDKRILNLTGKTATDIKLEYGASNLSVLTEYDENYILLVRTLQQYADALCTLGYTEDALPVLEYAISIGSDIKATYMLLADIYHQRGLYDKISELADNAQKLNSLMKQPIINALNELLSEHSPS